MKEWGFMFVVIALILGLVVGYQVGILDSEKDLGKKRYGRNDQTFKELGYKHIISGDSAKVKMVYLGDDSMISYELFIRFSDVGYAKEAYEKKDFRPKMQLLESHGLGLRTVSLPNPTQILNDSLGFIGLKYKDRFRVSFKTYNLIENFSVEIISEIIGMHKK